MNSDSLNILTPAKSTDPIRLFNLVYSLPEVDIPAFPNQIEPLVFAKHSKNSINHRMYIQICRMTSDNHRMTSYRERMTSDYYRMAACNYRMLSYKDRMTADNYRMASHIDRIASINHEMDNNKDEIGHNLYIIPFQNG